MIRFDYLLQESIKEMPLQFETINREELKENYNALLKDDEWVEQYLPHLREMAPRQRYRTTYLDAFHYPVWEPITTSTISPLPEVQKVLFDYSSKESKWLLLNQE